MKSRNRLRQPFFVSILLVLYSLWAFMRVKGSESIPPYHMALLVMLGMGIGIFLVTGVMIMRGLSLSLPTDEDMRGGGAGGR